MNKAITVILILSLSIVGFSQENSREKTRAEVKQYFETTIYPEIQKQQENYVDKLTKDENEQLEKIRSQITMNKPNSKNGSRGKGNANNGKSKNNCTNNANVREDVKKITDSHPKLNKSYLTFIKDNKENWMSEIAKLHDNNVQSRSNRDGNTGLDVFFEKVSSPSWLLLWDANNPRMANPRSKGLSNNDRHSRRNCSQSNSQFMDTRNSYIDENIIPVIAAERESFDVNLSFDEKKIIETAREKIQVRKIMFKSWYESEDFVPGQRANDPNFDNMREDMRSSMDEVREIASDHNAEIRESISNIKSHSDEWRSDMQDFGDKYEKGKQRGKKGKNMFKILSPVKFLIFDPAMAEEDNFLDIKNELRVVVYPNPIVNNATVAIMGAMDNNVGISLYSKDGEKIKDVYNATNKEERLEVTIDVSELANDVYIVKIATDNNEISRKIVVKK